MAHKTPLATWLYLNRTVLAPTFTEFKGTGELAPGLFDFSTKIMWQGTEIEGRGVDDNREIAFEKSVAEGIERIICAAKNINSVGLAVSGGSHCPEAHAKFETLERFYLDEHLHKRIPLIEVKSDIILPNTFLAMNPECEVRFFQMATPTSLYGLVCQISDIERKSFGFALSDSMENSQRRSFLESIPSFCWLKNKNELNQSASSVPWQISKEFISKISPLLGSIPVNDFRKSFFPKLVSEEVIYSDIPILKSALLKVSKYKVVNMSGDL
nr:hypothetical protein HAGR004_03070 [Bdellovibrio sp. HAGR004]